MSQSWNDIIEGCKRHEHRSLMEAYNHVWRIIFPAVNRIIQNRQEAEDIMQDSIIKGFDKLNELNDPEKYIAWQKRISIRSSYNYLRDQKRHLIDFPTEVVNTESEDDDQMLSDETNILKALNSLASGYQMIIKMHLLDEMPHEEIAIHLGLSASTVRSQYSRALSRLKLSIHEQREHQI